MEIAKVSRAELAVSKTEPTLTQAAKPLCFVISSIGSDGSDVRKTANKVLKHIIAKPLDKKYRIERADEISKPGMITMQIIQRLQDAELVIADLTGGNPNVYYELAIRHYLAKPIVHIIAVGEEAPFDVNQMRFVPFDIADPDSIESAQKELLAHVEALEKGEKVITPIQVAHILAEPASAGKGNEIVDVLNALYGAVSNLQQEMRSTKEFVHTIYSESRPPRMFGTNLGLAPGMQLSSLAGPVPSTLSVNPYFDQGLAGTFRSTFRDKKEAQTAKESTPKNPAEDSPSKKK